MSFNQEELEAFSKAQYAALEASREDRERVKIPIEITKRKAMLAKVIEDYRNGKLRTN